MHSCNVMVKIINFSLFRPGYLPISTRIVRYCRSVLTRRKVLLVSFKSVALGKFSSRTGWRRTGKPLDILSSETTSTINYTFTSSCSTSAVAFSHTEGFRCSGVCEGCRLNRDGCINLRTPPHPSPEYAERQTPEETCALRA